MRLGLNPVETDCDRRHDSAREAALLVMVAVRCLPCTSKALRYQQFVCGEDYRDMEHSALLLNVGSAARLP
jgi:hypothetical protein